MNDVACLLAKLTEAWAILEEKAGVWEDIDEAKEKDYRLVETILANWCLKREVGWLTYLCSVKWWLLDSASGEANQDSGNSEAQRVCSKCRGSHLSASTGRSTLGHGGRRIWPIFAPRVHKELWGFRASRGALASSIPSTGCLRVHRSLQNQSTCCWPGKGVGLCLSWYSVGECSRRIRSVALCCVSGLKKKMTWLFFPSAGPECCPQHTPVCCLAAADIDFSPKCTIKEKKSLFDIVQRKVIQVIQGQRKVLLQKCFTK